MTTEPTMSAAELQDENHVLRAEIRRLLWLQSKNGGGHCAVTRSHLHVLESRVAALEARAVEWQGSALDCHYDARCDALSQRLDALEGPRAADAGDTSPEATNAALQSRVRELLLTQCSPAQRRVLEAMERVSDTTLRDCADQRYPSSLVAPARAELARRKAEGAAS